MHLLQYVVHRVADGAGHGAVDGRGGGLVLERAGVGRHASSRNRSMAQRPEERLVPVLAHIGRLHVGERTRDTLVRVVHRAIDRRAVLCNQAIFLIPDVIGRFLIRNAADIIWLDLDHRIHGFPNRSLIVMARSSKTSGVGPSTRKCRPVISSTGTIANFPTTTYCGWVRRVRPERDDRQGFLRQIPVIKLHEYQRIIRFFRDILYCSSEDFFGTPHCAIATCCGPHVMHNMFYRLCP